MADSLSPNNSEYAMFGGDTKPVEYAPFGGDTGPVVGTSELNQARTVSTRGDDAGVPTLNKTQQTVNSTFNGIITPQPNILSDYSSYTYQMTWYLLTPQQYTSMVSMGVKNSSTWQILMQSGGASSGTAPSMGSSGFGAFMDSLLGSNSSSQGNLTGVRNKYFNLDYYMDDFEIETLIPLKGTGAAHSATNITFTVTEPMGVTLIDNLYKAVSDLYKGENGGKSTNYSMAMYCLGIRFYGYDAQGNLVKVGKSGQTAGFGTTSSSAIVEKFFPFVLKNISFRMTTAAVRYKVECAPQGQFYNIGTDRGTVPFPLELTGQTAKDILVSGGTATSGEKTTPKTDGRQSTPAPKAAPPKPAPIFNPSAGIAFGGDGGGATADAVGADFGP